MGTRGTSGCSPAGDQSMISYDWGTGQWVDGSEQAVITEGPGPWPYRPEPDQPAPAEQPPVERRDDTDVPSAPGNKTWYPIEQKLRVFGYWTPTEKRLPVIPPSAQEDLPSEPAAPLNPPDDVPVRGDPDLPGGSPADMKVAGGAQAGRVPNPSWRKAPSQTPAPSNVPLKPRNGGADEKDPSKMGTAVGNPTESTQFAYEHPWLTAGLMVGGFGLAATSGIITVPAAADLVPGDEVVTGGIAVASATEAVKAAAALLTVGFSAKWFSVSDENSQE